MLSSFGDLNKTCECNFDSGSDHTDIDYQVIHKELRMNGDSRYSPNSAGAVQPRR